ncbi:MAG: phosphoribosylanthranilate isomerase [Pseudomonadota bacterium]
MAGVNTSGGFVKICGMTDAAAVAAAMIAGADAIGFVFAPSVRRVTPEFAAQLAAPARGRLLCVAVTQHPQPAELAAILAVFQPDVLQTEAGDFESLTLPAGIVALPVLRHGKYAAAQPSARVLFEGPRSGTGQVADWAVARRLAAHSELILAGGLAPDNVAAAIAAVRPFGVDVSSGVEEAPGKKSPAKIANFVVRARAAFARLATESTA